MMEKTAKRTVAHRWLKWSGPACLLLAAGGIALASHYWYNPRSLPLPWFGPQWGQVLFFGGIPLVIALLSLLSPAPVGILGLFITLLTVPWYAMRPIPPTPLMPPFVYFPLYGIFAAGCVLQIVMGTKAAREAPRITSATDRGIRQAARITSLFVLLLSVIAAFIYPAGPAIDFIILGWMATGLAWFWSGAGGVLIVLLCGGAMAALNGSNYDPAPRNIYSALLMLFLAGAILHLAAAARRTWAGARWQPLLAAILGVGFVVTIALTTGSRHGPTNTPGTVAIPPPNVPTLESYVIRVEPKLEAELLGIARADPAIHQLIQSYTRTLSVGGKPYLDEGYSLSVGAQLRPGVTMAERVAAGSDQGFITGYMGSLNVGFVFEKEHHLYTFSIDLENKKVFNLNRVN